MSKWLRSAIVMGVFLPISASFAGSGAIYGKADPMASSFYEHSLAAEQQNFPTTFQVKLTSKESLTQVNACPPRGGKNTSPAVSWNIIPNTAKRLHLVLEDSTCTWGCDTRGKFDHWVMDFPVSAMNKTGPLTTTGIAANAIHYNNLKQYFLPNGLAKNQYLGVYAPQGQTHAFVLLLIAYCLS
jgi:phosphatidylethanolamine-binding protein (PEBP) family uncharacterized protein